MEIVNNHDGTYSINYTPIDDDLAYLVQPLALEIQVRMIDQPNHIQTSTGTTGLDETWLVTYLPAICDCDLITWDTPLVLITAPELTVGVTFSDSVSIQEPTVNAASKLPTPEVRKCYTGSGCDETFTNVLTVAKDSDVVGH